MSDDSPTNGVYSPLTCYLPEISSVRLQGKTGATLEDAHESLPSVVPRLRVTGLAGRDNEV